MAFDKTTRNNLASMVAAARRLLVEEFTTQLQSIYGMQPDGTFIPLEKLSHLTDEQHKTAKLLRERLVHLEASASDVKHAAEEMMNRMLREQAFTVLNRFCALRMCEERGIVQECIRGGINSKGFQIYLKLAGNALGETFDRYRVFLECMEDELAVDLGVLFDRNSPQALLFPRENSLFALLDILNASDLRNIWSEDETIGWIYQYYNDPDERKKMRKASAAPRNSRELAVRNQFFTPRYVVEFLTDNTLGRIWYEMTKGETLLKEQCRYLVRRPTEIFLAEGEAAPEIPDQEGLSQEELLRQPVHIQHRPIKDPREIRLLDPACGSMHFGLYAFDLFETIYEEAWDKGYCPALQKDYHSKDEFFKDVPRLIIEHNIHGIDIDPRAVQIAGLSLWLRAQKAWQTQGVKPAGRPCVRRSNIVCAEPMPGSVEMLEEFVTSLNQPVLGELVKTVFDKMKLAGEAGSLLKIEEEIRSAIETARKDWLKQQNDLFTHKDGSQEEFFQTTEQQVIDALRAYAEQADSDSYQRRLFADDAARGFAFIDLCRKRYDAIVMNPPFGAPSLRILDLMQDAYAEIKTDLYGAFVIRVIGLTVDVGKIGAITSRTGFFVSSFQQWREKILLPHVHLAAMLDLGGGVLDAAMVETAAYILEKFPPKRRKPSVFLRLATAGDRETAINEAIHGGSLNSRSPYLYLCLEAAFSALPKSSFCYWIPNSVHSAIMNSRPFEPQCGTVYVGVQTDNDARFVRVWVENSPMNLGSSLSDSLSQRGWITFLKGDSTSPFYIDHHLTLNWYANGLELRASTEKAPGGRINNENIYYMPGISWALRTDYFSPHIVPAGCIPSISRYEAIPEGESRQEILAFTAQFSAPLYDFIAKLQMEKWKQPKFIPGVIRNLPVPKTIDSTKANLSSLATEGIQASRLIHQTLETCREYLLPWIGSFELLSISNSAIKNRENLAVYVSRIIEASRKISQCVDQEFGLSDGGTETDWFRFLETDSEEEETAPPNPVENLHNRFVSNDKHFTNSIFSWLTGLAFGRWDIRYANGDRQHPELSDPFDPLPVCPPGMLQNAEGLPAEPKDVPIDYPLRISWPGILVDDENHFEDIIARVREAIEVIWPGSADSGSRAEAIEQEACGILGVKTLRDYFRRPVAFFADHLKRYSRSRRQAPIYWPLSTASGSYTLWIYYHRLDGQTLFSCVNDFIEPKIREVSRDIEHLQSELAEGGSTKQRDELEKQQNFRDELDALRIELLSVAEMPYKPDLNDGVIINAAPLWKLFLHKPWQKACKECWKKIEAGDYDWAHMAYKIWPDRVREKCRNDKSLAIAHDLESVYEESDDKVKTRKK